MPEIVKVQLPLSDPNGPALIYDATRERKSMRRLSSAELSLIKGAVKRYCFAAWSDDRGWKLIGRAPEQDW